jgi:HTH-type transcriptional regulator/antitoxin HigA
MKKDLNQMRYEYALNRVEELLPLVNDAMPASTPESMELAIMSEFVIAYEKEHFPIGKPTVSELIQDSLEEKSMTQKQLAAMIGVSPSRVSDYVSGRAEPTLRIAKALCAVLGISPVLMLGL